MSLESDERGKLLRRVLAAQGIGKTVKRSYNDFVREEIPRVMASKKLVFENSAKKFEVTFHSPELRRPSRTVEVDGVKKLIPYLPREARDEQSSYVGQLHCKFRIEEFIPTSRSSGREYQLIKKSENDLIVCKMPIMLGSDWDNLLYLSQEEFATAGESKTDPGGYYVINGVEKILTGLENLRTKKSILYYNNSANSKAGEAVVRYTGESPSETTVVQISPDKHNVVKIGVSRFEKLTTLTNIMNVFYLMYLGKGYDLTKIGHLVSEEIKWFIPNDKTRRERASYYLLPTIEAFRQSNPEAEIQAVVPKAISTRRIEELATHIINGMFINVNVSSWEDEVHAKRMILLEMLAKIVDFKNGYRSLDSRDDWGNKRVVLSGKHMKTLFVKGWMNTLKHIQNVTKFTPTLTPESIRIGWGRCTIGTDYVKDFKSKNWAGVKTATKSTTVVDDISRGSPLDVYYWLNIINTSIAREGQQREIRKVAPTQVGYVCFVTTPTGKTCGMIRNLSITTEVSVYRDPHLIVTVLFEDKKQNLLTRIPDKDHQDPIKLNGVIIGFGNAKFLRERVIQLRREGRIWKETAAVIPGDGSLDINTDSDRPIRPLLVINKVTGRPVYQEKNLQDADFETLLRKGAIDYVDINEFKYSFVAEIPESYQSNMQIRETLIREMKALNPDDPRIKTYQDKIDAYTYDFMEIDPVAWLGITPAIIPFISRNQGPRIAFQSAMGRNALTVDSARNDLSFYDEMKQIAYGDIGVVTTDIMDDPSMRTYPRINTAIVAFDMGGGGAQEDAIILNKSSLERGLFKTLIFKTIKTQIKSVKNREETLGLPPDYQLNEKERKMYQDIDLKTGIIEVGKVVKTGDVLIIKTETSKTQKGSTRRTVNIKVPINSKGVVDDVYNEKTSDGTRVIRVRLLYYKTPEVGDKFASMYSQKGTCGEIRAQVDMPFVDSDNPMFAGMVPDLIFNPLGIPTRMTIGKPLEMALGNIGLVIGKRMNASAFRSFNLGDLIKEMKAQGFNEEGDFNMIEGETGLLKRTKIFMGPIAYQTLRHLVTKKIQARGTGPMDLETRQPVHGITHEGGVRYGEMERDNTISHGAAQLLRERLMYSSDEYKMIICSVCGTMPNIDARLGSQVRCPICDKESNPVRTSVPYSYVLLQRYLAAMNIRVINRFD